MVNIGIVGIGFMGMVHFLAASRVGSARVAALCSRDPKKRAGDWTGIRGNFGPTGSMMDLSAQSRYAGPSELFGDPNVDLVDLCVPNDEHSRLAIRALEAGKHVLVEKPIALTTREADAMLAAAKANGRQLMVAHVLPFFPEFAYAAEAVRSGRFGILRAAHLTRVIARPDWSAGIADSSRSGGPAIDLHIHDTHFLGLLRGVPRAVRSCGVVEAGAVAHLTSQYLYDDPNIAVSAVSGALSQAGRSFSHGFELYLERASLTYSSANIAGRTEVSPLTLILPDGTVERPELGSRDPIDAFAAELAAAVTALEQGNVNPALSAELAKQALVVCLAEVESIRTGGLVGVH